MAEYKVKFKMVGIPWIAENHVKNKYVEAYNAFCDFTNPQFEVWNKEFDELYPDLDGDSKEYLDFIKEREMKFCEQYNKTAGIMWYDINEECQLIGHIKHYDDSSVSIYLEAV